MNFPHDTSEDEKTLEITSSLVGLSNPFQSMCTPSSPRYLRKKIDGSLSGEAASTER